MVGYVLGYDPFSWLSVECYLSYSCLCIFTLPIAISYVYIRGLALSNNQISRNFIQSVNISIWFYLHLLKSVVYIDVHRDLLNYEITFAFDHSRCYSCTLNLFSIYITKEMISRIDIREALFKVNSLVSDALAHFIAGLLPAIALTANDTGVDLWFVLELNDGISRNVVLYKTVFLNVWVKCFVTKVNVDFTIPFTISLLKLCIIFTGENFVVVFKRDPCHINGSCSRLTYYQWF